MDNEYLQFCKKDEFINPNGVCIICGESGIHKYCETKFIEERHVREQNIARKEIADIEYDREKLKKYSLSGEYGCKDEASILEFVTVLKNLQQKFPEAHSYEYSKVIENKDWWFIPRFYIGITGYIVEKESRSIFPIGSGYGCIWKGIESYINGEMQSKNS